MDSLVSGTFVGAGSFRCEHCGYTLMLAGTDALADCPECGGKDFVRASLFGTERLAADADPAEGTLAEPATAESRQQMLEARARLTQAGDYLFYVEGTDARTVPLTREWTRIGRSLAADVRFDDPTVSRRHALVVRQDDGVRLLDDRSLNGVFVNGERVDGRTLSDGDEIIVGRYRLTFLAIDADALDASQAGAEHSLPAGD